MYLEDVLYKHHAKSTIRLERGHAAKFCQQYLAPYHITTDNLEIGPLRTRI